MTHGSITTNLPPLHQWPSCAYDYCQEIQDEFFFKSFYSNILCIF